MERKLTDKQQRFVQEYLVDMNATQAATRAGYSKNNADKIGSQLLGKSRIKAALSKRMDKLESKTEITREKIIKEYAKLGFTDMPDFVTKKGSVITIKDFEELTPEQRACISSIEETKDGIRIKLHDKKGALDSLSRIHGLFSDKFDFSINGGLNINIVEYKKKKKK